MTIVISLYIYNFENIFIDLSSLLYMCDLIYSPVWIALS